MKPLTDNMIDWLIDHEIEQNEIWLEKLNDEHWESEWISIKEKDDAN